MKEKPILFAAPMVRAILEGRKTQTRRVIKNLEGSHANSWTLHMADGCADAWSSDSGWLGRCPYGQPGDRLWVRETWCPIYPQDPTYNGGRPIEIDYRATHSRESHWRVMDDHGTRRWKPSIHMPRWASRITLEIVAVRVERLNDISEADAIAEGVAQIVRESLPSVQQCGGYDNIDADPVDVFSNLWEFVNGPGSWAANPWVWVVEFRKV